MKNKLKKLIKKTTKNMGFQKSEKTLFYKNSLRVLKDLKNFQIKDLKVLIDEKELILLVAFQAWSLIYTWKYTF